MVHVFVKRFNRKLQAFMNSCIGTFIVFFILLLVTLYLECDRIDKARVIHEQYLDYCKMHATCGQEHDLMMPTAEKPTSFMSFVVWLFRLENTDVSRGRPTMWWSIFPLTSALQLETVYAFHQSAVKRLEYVRIDADYDNGYAGRILPPARPLKCCKNDESLPQLKTLYNDIFKRKPGQFVPDRKNRNLLFNAFYQYFVLQFFDVNSNLTVTASQLYGSDAVSERSMRSLSGGKLKTLEFNSDLYAPNQVFELRSSVFSKAWKKSISNDGSWLSRTIARIFKRADMLSASPMLFVMSTIWVREHNRVCDELSQKSPAWTDEELYTTARNIVTGQMMTIMMNEILNVKLRPEVYHHRMESIRGLGTPIELYLTMAVSSLPENLIYNSTSLMHFSNTRQVLEGGLQNAMEFMVNSKMGGVTAHNDGAPTESMTKALITLSREHCLQGFNSYRRRLGLKAYKSIVEMTRNSDTAIPLLELYQTVEKVEFLTGMLAEGTSSQVLSTAEVLTNSYIINAILTNNLTSLDSWVPYTFGGEDCFKLVKTANLKSLVCRNMECDGLDIQLYAK
ncbi:prostaglandin G/H synthase 2-like [Myzus persicae]|uniref:prostaglandin G/H synthase 2-like n=1 Tax=Myzus persicae TaxID=13164 RepID=UPI000B930F0A|nr:prostaglandin G/H synthase 2-like [Myzus persicae]